MMTKMIPKKNVGHKSNKAFMILSALGILFVLDSHVGPDFSHFFGIFPYDSFYMPMFAFISGYFFSLANTQSWTQVVRFIRRKISALLVPYFLCVLFYGVVTDTLRYFGVLDFGVDSLIDLIHNILTGGTSCFFNDPAWYVPLLFSVIFVYTILRKLLHQHWNDCTAMIAFSLLGAVAVALSRTDFRTHNTFMLMKIPCFLQYYHFGVLFRSKLEATFDQIPTLLLCSLTTAVNFLIRSYYGPVFYVPMYATMDGFPLNAPFIPLVASISGIFFWLKIAKCLVPLLGQNRLVNFISDNTFFFMTHHLTAKHIFLGLLISANHAGITAIGGIDEQQFRMYAWYTYGDSPLISVVCLLFSTVLLLITGFIFNHIKQRASLLLKYAFQANTKRP